MTFFNQKTPLNACQNRIRITWYRGLLWRTGLDTFLILAREHPITLIYQFERIIDNYGYEGRT